MTPPLIVISGQTATGKSALAAEIARRYGAVIVNADAMQVYRYMDIGTAKPSPRLREEVVHEMIDVVDPDTGFSAATYRRMAGPIIEREIGRGGRVIVVGGTGLYIKALLFGICPAPGPFPEVRKRLREMERGEDGILYRYLRRVDPKTAERVHPSDTFRIVRALEVYEKTGIPISRFREEHSFRGSGFEYRIFLLWGGKGLLRERIERRVEGMVREGLLDEVAGLLRRGYSPDLKPLKGIGYREMVACLSGEMGLDEAAALIKRNTGRYARRQSIWWRREAERAGNSVWVEVDEKGGERQSLLEAMKKLW